MYHISSIQFSIEGHLGWIQVPAITNNASMIIVEQMSLWMFFFCLNAYEWNCFILWLIDSNFLEELPYLFPKWFYDIVSTAGVEECSFPSPLHHKMSLVYFILAILIKAICYLIVILICISLMSKYIEHFL